tara:strand:- start:205 stop:465 length:261 start_codon:yes stop_codon:yes gene_type:complete
MLDIILALCDNVITSGQITVEMCQQFAVGTEYYSLLEQWACRDWTLIGHVNLSEQEIYDINDTIIRDIVNACDIESLRVCYDNDGC